MPDPTPSWVFRSDIDPATYTASDPLTVEEPEWHTLERDRSRDTVLLCIAGMVIIACLAYVAGARS